MLIATVERRNVVPLVTAAGIALAGMSDFPTSVSLGPVTGSALLTTAVAGLCAASLPALLGTPMWRLRPVLPLWGFVGWTLLIAAIKGVDVAGAQNLLVYGIFASAITFTAVWCDDLGAATVTRWLRRCGWLVATAFGVSLVLDGIGARSILGGRSFGLSALIFMALMVPDALRGGRASRALPWVLFLLVGLSLSKTATAVAGILLIVRAAHGRTDRRPGRAVALALVVGLGMMWTIFNVPTVTNRVFGGDHAFAVGGVTFDTEGRTKMWSAISSDIGTAPLLGHGAGAANARILQLLPTLGQPHNDYLRVTYDYGFVGLVLFVWAYFTLLRATGRRARCRGESLTIMAAPHTAALLALLAVAVSMSTDNVLIYSFVMAPLGVMVGLSLRQPSPSQAGDVGALSARAREDFVAHGRIDRRTSASDHVSVIAIDDVDEVPPS